MVTMGSVFMSLALVAPPCTIRSLIEGTNSRSVVKNVLGYNWPFQGPTPTWQKLRIESMLVHAGLPSGVCKVDLSMYAVISLIDWKPALRKASFTGARMVKLFLR